MPMIDYPEVRRRVNLETVLELIGYKWFASSRRSKYGRCPLSCSSSPRAASFDLQDNLWCCHRCGRGGNQIDLYAAVRSLDLYAAAVRLCEQANVTPPWLTQPAGRFNRPNAHNDGRPT